MRRSGARPTSRTRSSADHRTAVHLLSTGARWRDADLDRLFREHGPSLYRFLVGFAGDADLAADAVQETFVRYAEARLPIREPRAWLFRVAARLAMEWRRKDLRRAKLLAAVPTEALMSDPVPAADDALERLEERARVRAALDGLRERDRTVLLLREEGLTHREIAAAVGTTTGSVGTMIARALEKLAVELRLDAEDHST